MEISRNKKKRFLFEEKEILINTFFWYVTLLQTEILATRLDESWTQHFQLGLTKVIKFTNSNNGAWWGSPTFSEMSSGLIKLYCYKYLCQQANIFINHVNYGLIVQNDRISPNFNTFFSHSKFYTVSTALYFMYSKLYLKLKTTIYYLVK